MSINAYTGLQGSGKSYEVVSSVILPAISRGRRVVTNIEGIDGEAIRAYVSERDGVALDDLGHVVSVGNDEVSSPDFFPIDVAASNSSVVQPGDLVAVDEAWRFWGSDCAIHKNHRIFFREHRHFTHPVSGLACDLVVMVQDIGDLHRLLKVVVELSFKTHKAKGLGLNNVYTIRMWEGWKQNLKTISNEWTRTYNPEIFPLYKSYAGTAQGKEVASDSRQNIFSDKRLWFKVAIFLVLAFISLWRLYVFFNPHSHQVALSSPSSPGAVSTVSPAFSEWCVTGVIEIDGIRQVVLSGRSGMRIEPYTYFSGSGLGLSGLVDGRRVTRFSCGSSSSQKDILPGGSK